MVVSGDEGYRFCMASKTVKKTIAKDKAYIRDKGTQGERHPNET